MMDVQQEIKNRLQSLHPSLLELRDDSHLHKGHAGNRGGGHYTVLIVSDIFNNISRIQRQRMVKECLHDLFSGGMIHALSIKALSLDDYEIHH